MVEFALVSITLFFLVFAALDGSLLIFSFGTARFAAGEAARLVSEEGNLPSTDTDAVRIVRNTALGATSLAHVDEIDIFRLTQDGSGNLNIDFSKYNKYKLDGTPIGSVTWNPATRNVNNGQSDFAGVEIFYTYNWKTGIFAPAPPMRLTALFEIRLEPQNY